MNRTRSITSYIMIAVSFSLLVVCKGDAGSAPGDDMQVTQVEHKHTNHLIDEDSPYLLAHAHNPVDWYPWGEEALQRAKDEDKPIFLSIGYAACHWCHVMERESFENEVVAAILNQHYICIKVDREQRPDLDNIYMAFTQAMTGGGGWPMSVFLTPELKPFYAGTYFPVDDRYGRPGFTRLITEIAQAYQSGKDKILASADDITRKLVARLGQTAGRSELNAGMMAQAAVQLLRNFDQVNGGFGSAPKFPHATELSLFLRHYRSSGDVAYLQAAEKALTAMARGGIYDHLGGGFARYATDAKWLVPHFEKMLYDNGLLVPVYADVYQLTGDARYLDVIRGTLDFILAEMTDATGGFYSALDADSEGEEGKFYVWSKQEIDKVLGAEAELFCNYYNVTVGGNFEGHNILNLTEASEKYLAADPDQVLAKQIAKSRQVLLKARAKRIRPLTDDKILTSWNGLALSALCDGYRLTGDKRYLDAAIKNADFVRTELFRDNQLTHSYREERHSDGQFLEDYGYYLGGLLELYQIDHSSGNSRWLRFASRLADNAIDLFIAGDGALYMREAGQADLLFRPKEDTDNARPSPGSYLISALLKLGRLTENEAYSAAGEKALQALSGTMARRASSMASAILALDYFLQDKIEIVIVGNGDERARMLELLQSRFMPNTLLAVSEKGTDEWPLFEGRKANDGEAVAFVCRNSACRLPVTTAAELGQQLDELTK